MALGAFIVKEKLQDVERQYLQAIYRFRDAEEKQSASYTALKCEMNMLEARLFGYDIRSTAKTQLLLKKERRVRLSLIDAWSLHGVAND